MISTLRLVERVTVKLITAGRQIATVETSSYLTINWIVSVLSSLPFYLSIVIIHLIPWFKGNTIHLQFFL